MTEQSDSQTNGGTEPDTEAGFTALERIAVIVNGNAKRVTDELVETLDQIVQSGDLFVSRSLPEAQEIARTIVARGYPTVLTGGGDGTFVRMVTAIVREAERRHRTPPRFGLLKLGTGNALAWVLGAQNLRDRGIVADLARLRSEGGSRELRLIEVADLLTPFAGLGADAIALADYGKTKDWFLSTGGLRRVASGPVVYSTSILTRTVPRYLFRPALKVRVVNSGGDALRMGQNGQPVGAPIAKGELIYEGPIQMLAFSTIPYWGLGARVFPYAEDRPDRMHLRVVNFGSVEVLLNLRNIWQGTHRSDRMHDFLVEDFTVECEQPTPVQVGGDVLGERDHIRARVAETPIQVVDYYAPPPV